MGEEGGEGDSSGGGVGGEGGGGEGGGRGEADDVLVAVESVLGEGEEDKLLFKWFYNLELAERVGHRVRVGGSGCGQSKGGREGGGEGEREGGGEGEG